ncbi:hypothetical protein HanIR_Chr16g0824301 [Helianthus annuus]|nr:hypothetical protein HanIR_Chr16g0824301 [Helianthus annuus]
MSLSVSFPCLFLLKTSKSHLFYHSSLIYLSLETSDLSSPFTHNYLKKSKSNVHHLHLSTQIKLPAAHPTPTTPQKHHTHIGTPFVSPATPKPLSGDDSGHNKVWCLVYAVPPPPVPLLLQPYRIRLKLSFLLGWSEDRG